MSLDVVPAAINALTRESNRISQALDRAPDTEVRREALLNRGAALTKLIVGLAEKENGSAMRQAALEIERIGRRLSANSKNADEGAELLSIAQALAAAEPPEVGDDPKAGIETVSGEGERSTEVTTEPQEESVGTPPAGEDRAELPASKLAKPESLKAEISTKLEHMEVNMTMISETEAVNEQQEEPVEEQAGKRSDEALAGAWMAQNMAPMNKVARNRYGDGKEVCLLANRTAGRDQRNVVAQLPAESLDWARSARRTVRLVLFVRPEDVTAGASMRVVTATLTAAVALASSGKSAKVTISLWDEFGDVENANGVLVSEGAVDIQLTEIQVTSADI